MADNGAHSSGSTWVDEAKVREVVDGLRRTQLESITVLCEDLLPEQGSCFENCNANCLYLAPAGGPTPWLWDAEAHEQMLGRVRSCLRTIQHDCHLRFDMRLRYEHDGKRCVRLQPAFGSAKGWLTQSYPRQAYARQASISFLLQPENATILNDTACAESELDYHVGLGGDDVNCRIPSSGMSLGQTVKGNILRSESILEVNVTHLMGSLVHIGNVIAIRPLGKCLFEPKIIFERFSGKLEMTGALHREPPAASSAFSRLPSDALLVSLLTMHAVFYGTKRLFRFL